MGPDMETQGNILDEKIRFILVTEFSKALSFYNHLKCWETLMHLRERVREGDTVKSPGSTG